MIDFFFAIVRGVASVVGLVFALDPSRGQLLANLVDVPTWGERATDQGGVVGKIIMTLGVIAAVIAVLRIAWMFLLSMKVAAQKRKPE